MAAPRRAASKEPKSTGDVVSELWTLVKDYGRQETINPLKTLKNFVAFGAGAAVCWGLAGIFLALAVLRVFQVEGRRWLHGTWTFPAYFVAVAVLGLCAFLSVKQIKKGKSS